MTSHGISRTIAQRHAGGSSLGSKAPCVLLRREEDDTRPVGSGPRYYGYPVIGRGLSDAAGGRSAHPWQGSLLLRLNREPDSKRQSLLSGTGIILLGRHSNRRSAGTHFWETTLDKNSRLI